VKSLCVLAALLASATLALAFPYTYVVPTPTYVQPTPVRITNHRPFRHREVVQVITVAQINPAYTSAYSPEAYDPNTQAALLQQIATLQAQVQLLAAAGKAQPAIVPIVVAAPGPLAAPGLPAALAPATPAAPINGLALITAKCASCHKADTKLPSQSFVILDAAGKLAALTPQQKLKMLGKVYRQEMPPPVNTFGVTPLSDAEFAAFLEYLQ
jgi:mono/diheme cytochrome c family protein